MTTPRNFPHWLQAYTNYTSKTEAPLLFHFWAGVSAIAGALRRQVWIDQVFFEWVPNFYIVLVSEPGIVNKSTTIHIAKDLLQQIGGVNFGPAAITWQSLVNVMAASCESFEFEGAFHEMSAITCAASELGTFLDPTNREMVDVLVDLWDGKKLVWEKKTKTSGNDAIVNPWVNMIAGTTPSWLSEHFTNTMMGGGFSARCIFVYASKKKALIPYPAMLADKFHGDTRQKLIQDLEQISLLRGPMTITPEAYAWGSAWYENLYTTKVDLEHLADEKFAHYCSRRQTHLHKLAMVLSVAKRSTLTIEVEDFVEADMLLTATERDALPAIFSNIGKVDTARILDRLLYLTKATGRIPKAAALRDLLRIADPRTINDIITNAIAANLVKVVAVDGVPHLEATNVL